ncbi:hypothetical protein [Aliamphritea ceti]|uniref:hypothetical protein n=1 Tax=Aliamphritea ceti TaxID=1524258 RepID=UPI0021C30294|nr:hypothetical protein [Aliamphritea ceti]
MFDWLKDRAKERSTWRGLAILAGMAGVAVDPTQVEMIGYGVAGAIGAVETITQDKPAEA